MSEFQRLLTAEFGSFGALTDSQLTALEAHYQLLTRWNQKMNLTRIERMEDAVRLHYCESLFLGSLLPGDPLRIADVGSGAGFPGFPIAVLRRECSVTLIESNGRKAAFLREATRNLSNVAVVAGRAEDCQERFDWVVARAVSPNDVISLKLAPTSALLVSNAGAERLSAEVHPVPWGRERVVVVSRETLPTGSFHVEHPTPL